LQTNGISNDSEDEQKPAAEEVELPFTQSKPNNLSVPNAWKTNGIYNPWLQWGMNIHGLRVTNTCALDCTLYLLGFLTLNKCVAKQIVTVEPLTTALQYLKDQETNKARMTIYINWKFAFAYETERDYVIHSLQDTNLEYLTSLTLPNTDKVVMENENVHIGHFGRDFSILPTRLTPTK
jgi:hypothetical protein